MSLQDILNSKAAENAVKAAEGAGAPMHPAIPNIATGMQGSASVVSLDAPGLNDILPIATDPDPEKQAKALGTFRADGLRRFWLKNVSQVVPDNGYFYAQTDEELAELKHFAKTNQVTEITG